MSSDSTNLWSLLERPGRAHAAPPDAEPAVDDEREYVAFAHGRIGNRPQLTLVFRKCSGEVEGFPYAQFTRIHSVDPERGFTIEFAAVAVAVEGRQLGRLFWSVCEQRVAEIVEASRSAILSQDSAEPHSIVRRLETTYVARIDVQRLSSGQR